MIYGDAYSVKMNFSTLVKLKYAGLECADNNFDKNNGIITNQSLEKNYKELLEYNNNRLKHERINEFINSTPVSCDKCKRDYTKKKILEKP